MLLLSLRSKSENPLSGLKILLLACIITLVGCSSIDEEEELGPAELIDFEAEKSFKKLWSVWVGDGQGKLYNRLRPAIDGDMIFVAEADGGVEALALADGDDIWDVDLDHRISGAVGVIADVVYIGTLSGDIIALDKNSGEQLWQVGVGGEVLAAAAGDGELVFIQTLDDQLLALNALTGERVWSYRNSMPVLTLRGTSTPVYQRGMVAAGFSNGKVLGFDAKTGAVRWNVRVAASKGHSEIERIVDVDGDLLIEDGSLYAVSYQGAITAVDLASGKRTWTREASSYVSMGYGFGNVYVAGFEGNVTAYADNGQGVRWEQTVLARRKLTGPITLGNYVVVGDVEGYMHAMSQVDGHMVARTQVDSDGMQTRLLVHENVLYAYTNDGTLAAYELVDKPTGFFAFIFSLFGG